MSRDNKELLLDKNASPEGVNDFIALTENCEVARYVCKCYNPEGYGCNNSELESGA
jgi:hypothetical protein